MSNYDKLKDILKEIFEIDKADLDFGIYRIMNQKRDQVNDFINTRLPKDIKDILAHTQSKDGVTLKAELDKMGRGLDEAGVLRESAPKYLALKQQMELSIDTNALEQEVFSHLAAFFKRYYKEGDFISMRRYKKDVYAIPYEGEEVKLHWANHDQYYIKTSEYLKNYSFRLRDGKAVHFRLKEASTEQNNNKTQGDAERRFAVYAEHPFEVEDGALYVNFTYEPHKKTVKQDELNQQAISAIQQNLPGEFAALFDKAPTETNKTRTLLDKHLKDYIRRNSFDYFIHKDLGGFLRRELDFYIKNEVLFIDDINTENPAYFTAQLSKIKALKKVACEIIDFLTQIEEFQKKLWLKKKFVVSTGYCITLDRIPQEFHPEIVANAAQLAEWAELFGVTITRQAELTDESFLVLDTKHFSEDFTDRLLGHEDFTDLDEQTDGLLINSENFQALNVLQEKYREKVNAVHIDPPYNTNTSGFLYKNSFQSSSWMSFMYDRALMSVSLLNDNGSFISHIDENEYERLFLLLEHFPFYNSGTVIWDKRNPMTGGAGIATQHEYILWKNKNVATISLNGGNVEAILTEVTRLKNKYKVVTDEARKEYVEWINAKEDLSGGERAYRYLDDNWNAYQSVSLRAPEKRENEKFHQPLIHPITGKPCGVPPNGFSRTPETLQQMVKDDLILFGRDETTQPRQKMILRASKKKQLTSVIQDATRGKSDLDKLGLFFPYNHSANFYKFLLDATIDEKNKYILDYFAGSGTTGHATIKLNREDNGRRKYILVEMGTYFNTVTKPRIQKVIYTDNWKGGQPQDKKGLSQLFKYQVLESYEDALNNLQLKPKTGILQFNEAAQHQYLLKYMLDLESRDHLFDINIFRDPFNYRLNITQNNEMQPTKIDLVETFNYLIGLYVSRIQRVKDIKLVEGRTREGKKTLVIWRNLDTTTNSETQTVFRKLYDSIRSAEFDQIFINGDHHFDNHRQGQDQFKVKLIEETFFKKMFNN